MCIASLVLGIISLLISWIPIAGFIVAIVALIIAIIAIAKKDLSVKNKDMGIAGLVLSILAVIVSLAISFVTVATVGYVFNKGGDIISKAKIAAEESEFSNAKAKLKVEYETIKSLNEKNEYTGYIDRDTKLYTDAFHGIEIEEYYENVVNDNAFSDYSVEVDKFGKPTIEVCDDDNDYVEKMQYVDRKINQLRTSELYNQLSIEDKVTEMEKLLKELERENYINGYTYNSDSHYFGYEYSDGGLGGIMLKDFDPMTN